jgi:hypothetical protein
VPAEGAGVAAGSEPGGPLAQTRLYETILVRMWICARAQPTISLAVPSNRSTLSSKDSCRHPGRRVIASPEFQRGPDHVECTVRARRTLHISV